MHMAMCIRMTEFLSSKGYCNPCTKTQDCAYHSIVDKTSIFARLRSDTFLFSEANLKSGILPNSRRRWNPLLVPSPNMLRKGMGLRGSQSDGRIVDGGLVPQYAVADNKKSTSTLDGLLEANYVHNSCTTTAAVYKPLTLTERIEGAIERAIFDCRFLTLFGVVGSLLGSMLCFLQGSMFVLHSFKEFVRAYIHNIRSSQVILYLVEAVDVYLMGTVMLIFGMGLYELFVSSLEVPGAPATGKGLRGSNLFGLFTLQERPKWLEIRSLDELKTKLGHVIVMILLVGMFEKSKRVPIHSGVDLLCFAGSILLASSCLYLLSMLHSNGKSH
ncbi:hypothetical protein Mapa_005669 [Marchantia paleacea]|nr:hypothetical protein Mapa_005669 [Marchantia paleacea]